MILPALCLRFEQFRQPGKSRAQPDILYRHIHRFGTADENQQFARPGHSGIEQIALKHHVMLGEQRDDYCRKFTAL